MLSVAIQVRTTDSMWMLIENSLLRCYWALSTSLGAGAATASNLCSSELGFCTTCSVQHYLSSIALRLCLARTVSVHLDPDAISFKSNTRIYRTGAISPYLCIGHYGRFLGGGSWNWEGQFGRYGASGIYWLAVHRGRLRLSKVRHRQFLELLVLVQLLSSPVVGHD